MGAPLTRPMQNLMIILFPLTFQMVEAAKIFEGIKGVFTNVNIIETHSGNMMHLNHKYKHVQDHAKRGELQVNFIGTLTVWQACSPYLNKTTFGEYNNYPGFGEKLKFRSLI